MKSPLSSNLIWCIQTAIDNCFYNKTAHVFGQDGLETKAAWIHSKRDGYDVMELTIIRNGIVQFSYVDYGTECKKC